jgi:hypothetical protein
MRAVDICGRMPGKHPILFCVSTNRYSVHAIKKPRCDVLQATQKAPARTYWSQRLITAFDWQKPDDVSGLVHEPCSVSPVVSATRPPGRTPAQPTSQSLPKRQVKEAGRDASARATSNRRTNQGGTCTWLLTKGCDAGPVSMREENVECDRRGG